MWIPVAIRYRVTYPPYNIERTDENPFIGFVARGRGFAEKDMTVEVKEACCRCRASARAKKRPPTSVICNQGIAGVVLSAVPAGENVEVRGAALENGLLHIELERIVARREEPRRISINAKSDGRVLETKAKAA